jgi:cytosine/adenosine deaminase-related metal-dependent hydrolase
MALRTRRFVLLGLFVAVLLALTVGSSWARGAGRQSWDAAHGILIAGATVVTMDDAHDVIPHGRVLVRDGRIVAVWQGPTPPAGVDVGGASVVEAGPQELVFPGLINLHDHLSFDFLDPWLPPSSHAISAQGKAGTDPYANRYQWGATGSPTAPPEQMRLIAKPQLVLNDPMGLGLGRQVNRYAQTAALLGGETLLDQSDGDIVRGNVDNGIDSRVAPDFARPIASLDGSELTDLKAAMTSGQVDAWELHLAEGVRDGDRRPGDPVSSRAELQTLEDKGLLTDMTVIVHGTGLERSDFAAMRAAPSIRTDGVGDGLGAKLVWSPLSNLLLYGKTTNVYDALAEGVLVSLGTDWTPSGSRTLLHELKVADVAMRDPRILGGSRDEVPSLAVDGKQGHLRQLAEELLDQTLVDMVTRNPALTLRLYGSLGSIETGKAADLLLIHRPTQEPPHGLPPSVYRDLIDATERDVELVLVAGDPKAGDPALLSALKPGEEETVTSAVGGYSKAVDITSAAPLPDSGETLADTTVELNAAVTALGGDNPPAAGGPGPPGNTYSYLQAHAAGGAFAAQPPAVFTFLLGTIAGTLPDGSVNLERIRLDPLFEEDNTLLTHIEHADVDPATGLIADPTPPYKLYPANLNFLGSSGDPLATIP